MQFLQPTFDTVVANRPTLRESGSLSPDDPADAIPAAAAYLCSSGARDKHNLRKALYAYNHSPTYVREVLATARRYRHAPARASNPRAARAIAFARAHLGQPYRWGGNGPADGGFDCSGLPQAAYAATGIPLPRVAEDQYPATTEVPAADPLRPGDLVFYGHPGTIHHVGLYTGGGQMIHAPKPGATIRTEHYQEPGTGEPPAPPIALTSHRTASSPAGTAPSDDSP
ncbi:hypothetical protein GCM10009801_75550 [Streptomyces albiaxialis]|uniref:NlpC/P60 domain-containing protein n=1 Tax=Streptomyces albiaxialis TaxID=329523 RepID=A0ABP5IKV7_9ACTN